MRTFDFAVLPHETAFASVLHMHKRLASQQRKHHREELHTDHRPTVRSFGKKGKKGSVTSLTALWPTEAGGGVHIFRHEQHRNSFGAGE